MKSLIVAGYSAAHILYALTLLTCLMGWNGLSRFLSVMALALNGSILISISIVSGQPPVFEVSGSLLAVAFVLGILGAFCCRAEEGRLTVRAWVWIEMVFVLGIALFFTKGPTGHNWYYHTYVWVILFHGFRVLALSFALFSAAHFIRFRLEPERRRANNPLFNQGRNFLLLSALAYFCGEYAGMIWCQNGWGDFWHWSPTFFQSTLIILCLMVAFHIPGNNPRSDDLRSVMAVIAPLLMLSITVVKGLS
jgi:hypothetical protein